MKRYKIELTYPDKPEDHCGFCVGIVYYHEYIPEDPGAFEYWHVPHRRAYLFEKEELEDPKLKEYLERVKKRFGNRIVEVEVEDRG